MVGRWSKAEWAEDWRWAEGGLVEVVGPGAKGLHEDTGGEVPKVATGADQRALGVQVDMEGHCTLMSRVVLWRGLVLRWG